MATDRRVHRDARVYCVEIPLVAGMAAVIATIHDVLITLGLFALFRPRINLNVIAALLTLIGYSMNDKIVVFRQSPRERGRQSR